MRSRILKIIKIDFSDYEAYIQKVEKYFFLNKPEFIRVINQVGYHIQLLGLEENGELIGVSWAYFQKLFLGKRMDIMADVITREDRVKIQFYEQLKMFAKSEKVSQLVINLNHDYRYYDLKGNATSEPRQEMIRLLENCGYQKDHMGDSATVGLPSFQYLKELKPFMPDDFNGLLKSFNKNSQRNIKKAKQLGVQIRKAQFDELEEFRMITRETAERQGFSDKSLAYYQALFNEFNSETEFLIAELDFENSISHLEDQINALNPSKKQDQQRISLMENDLEMIKEIQAKTQSKKLTLANMIMIYQNHESTYFLGGSLTDYQKIPAPFLLQYEAMMRSMERGIELYNFYGISGCFDGSDGVLRFKQNFNGYIVEKIGTFIYYPQPLLFKLTKFIKDSANKLLGRT